MDREDLQETSTLEIFRAFLRALFNKARSAHDAADKAAWPDVGDVLTKSWNAVPIEPLRRIVSDGLDSITGVPDFIDISAVVDTQVALEEWERIAIERPGDLIANVEIEPLRSDAPLARYDLHLRRVVVNKSHPFFVEHGETHEQQLLLRDTALVDLLTDSYMADIGIDPGQLRRIREYRDQLLRLIAQVNRRSGAQIAAMLLDATAHAKGFEQIVGDALEYLGFSIQRLAQSGEPEGVATAPITPESTDVNADAVIRTYSFTYDAKSSKNGKAKTKDLNVAVLKLHRDKYSADHTLVVAPDYEMGGLQEICAKNHITPMRAPDLATLLMLAATGPLDLGAFRTVFALTDPNAVHAWVSDLSERLTSTSPKITLGLLLRTFDEIGFRGPNAIQFGTIADRINQRTDGQLHPKVTDIRSATAGIAVLAPHLVRITPDNSVFLGTSPQLLREELLKQIRVVPEAYRFGLDRMIGGQENGRE